MPQLSPDAVYETRKRIGSQERAYSWPLAFRLSTRPHELGPDVASQLNDFLSTENGLTVRDGFSAVGAALADIPLLLSTYEQRSAATFPLAFTKSKIYKYVGPNWSDISRGGGYSGSDDQPWSAATVLNFAVATNYLDKVQYWDGVAGTFVDIPAAAAGKTLENTRARYVVQFGGRLWLLNLVETGAISNALRVRWSVDQSFANDADWNGAVAGTGFADLDETPDGITGVAKLGRLLVVYKRRSLYHVYETFDINAPFTFDLRASAGTDRGVGLISQATLADVGGFHIGLWSDNVYIYDTVTPKPIGDSVIRDVIQNAGAAQIAKSFSSLIPQLNYYILWVPLGGQTWPENGYVYDYRRDLWVGQIKKRVSASGALTSTSDVKWQDETTVKWQDANFSWASLAQANSFPNLLVGNPDTKVVQTSLPQNPYDGVQAEWYTRDEDFGYADQNVGVSRIRVRVLSNGAPGVLSVAISTDSGRTFGTTATGSYTSALGEQDVFLDVFAYGRRLMFKFTSTTKIRIVEWAPRYAIRGKAA